MLKQLLFSDVDGLAFAALRGTLRDATLPATYVPKRLGPFLELLQLSKGGQVPRPTRWLAINGFAPFATALDREIESWVAPADRHTGFIRAARQGSKEDSRLTAFLMTAKRAGQQVSGLPAAVAGRLVAAMAELESNIHEHTEAPETGILAYRAAPEAFEFVASDRGIGVLRSLRQCADYAALADHGMALGAALTEGISRHGSSSNHGHGFRPIFAGLMNLNGELRFRSGDHAITMDGTSPALATSRIAQKPPIDGFFASVRCRIERQEQPDAR